MIYYNMTFPNGTLRCLGEIVFFSQYFAPVSRCLIASSAPSTLKHLYYKCFQISYLISPLRRTDRPQSWTDRILHTAGTSLRYDSIHFEFADHYPVFEEFQIIII